MIVDAHCHAGTGGNTMTGPWDVRARLGAYVRRARAAGIGRSILIPAFHTDYRTANREVGEIATAHPDRFWWFCMVHPERDRGRIEALVGTAVTDHGARGIKVHRHDAPLTREVCEAARRYQLPILYDPMSRPATITLVASEYPDVPIIVPHLGSFGDSWEAHAIVIDQLRFPNVFADSSGVRRFDFLVEALKRAGPSKLIFGSDGPWLHPGVELAKIRLLGLRPRDEALVTGGNIVGLIAPSRDLRRPADRVSEAPLLAARRDPQPAGAAVHGS